MSGLEEELRGEGITVIGGTVTIKLLPDTLRCHSSFCQIHPIYRIPKIIPCNHSTSPSSFLIPTWAPWYAVLTHKSIIQSFQKPSNIWRVFQAVISLLQMRIVPTRVPQVCYQEQVPSVLPYDIPWVGIPSARGNQLEPCWIVSGPSSYRIIFLDLIQSWNARR